MEYSRNVKKTVFRFPGEDRSVFAPARPGSEMTVRLLSPEGESVALPLRVTRCAKLGLQRWIYAQVLDAQEGLYYQIEFRLHPDDPRSDTAEMYLQAPPLKIETSAAKR